eukprot:m.5455 g.5455  ORF g.5455 m.5455 type:complete len:390 (-) comp1709_c0_seq2:160-1329(-)
MSGPQWNQQQQDYYMAGRSGQPQYSQAPFATVMPDASPSSMVMPPGMAPSYRLPMQPPGAIGGLMGGLPLQRQPPPSSMSGAQYGGHAAVAAQLYHDAQMFGQAHGAVMTYGDSGTGMGGAAAAHLGYLQHEPGAAAAMMAMQRQQHQQPQPQQGGAAVGMGGYGPGPPTVGPLSAHGARPTTIVDILHSRRDPTNVTEGDVLVLRAGESEPQWEPRAVVAMEAPTLLASFPFKLLGRNRIDCPPRDFERFTDTPDDKDTDTPASKRAREKAPATPASWGMGHSVMHASGASTAGDLVYSTGPSRETREDDSGQQQQRQQQRDGVEGRTAASSAAPEGQSSEGPRPAETSLHGGQDRSETPSSSVSDSASSQSRSTHNGSASKRGGSET